MSSPSCLSCSEGYNICWEEMGFCTSGQEVKLGELQDQFQHQDYSGVILSFQKGTKLKFSIYLFENHILLGTTP